MHRLRGSAPATTGAIARVFSRVNRTADRVGSRRSSAAPSTAKRTSGIKAAMAVATRIATTSGAASPRAIEPATTESARRLRAGATRRSPRSARASRIPGSGVRPRIQRRVGTRRRRRAGPRPVRPGRPWRLSRRRRRLLAVLRLEGRLQEQLSRRLPAGLRRRLPRRRRAIAGSAAQLASSGTIGVKYEVPARGRYRLGVRTRGSQPRDRGSNPLYRYQEILVVTPPQPAPFTPSTKVISIRPSLQCVRHGSPGRAFRPDRLHATRPRLGALKDVRPIQTLH